MRGPARLAARAFTVVGALLVLGGLGAIGLAVLDGEDAPRGAAPVVAQGSASAPAEAARVPSMSPSEPVGLEIPAINVRSAVVDVGLDPDGTIEVPQPGPWYDSAAWYRYSPTPGEHGPTVIEGHIDSPAGLSVFARLGEIVPGDEVLVHREDGLTVIYRVTGIRQVSKEQFPTAEVYGDLDHAGLRLITCGGGIDRSSGQYRDNVLVFAAFAGAEPTPAGAPNAANGPVPLPVYATPTPTPAATSTFTPAPTTAPTGTASPEPTSPPSGSPTPAPTPSTRTTTSPTPSVEPDLSDSEREDEEADEEA